jgi:hypothetical protein
MPAMGDVAAGRGQFRWRRCSVAVVKRGRWLAFCMWKMVHVSTAISPPGALKKSCRVGAISRLGNTANSMKPLAPTLARM